MIGHRLRHERRTPSVWTAGGSTTSGGNVAFVWPSDTAADSYVLQIGSSAGGSNQYNANVGNNLTYTVRLDPGVYYSRVITYSGTSALSTYAEQSCTVT